ncbi:antibiotic biosynthesis monooxygenase family protein [Nocardia sp. CDC153]|uniref:antibiotic biosynthesis monooxygenase family protein n=1 Tax=Nocardia sp. CDC153 TaxID=3112167 RepID=UPI002DBD5889|nr:antibiotic biosynthesis monooxygenase family protein [Nocardia sp. CDC153]MEC3952027.1 antibiotic biosynthesis monooxygenase family protein [Nocardia sp. CDC153]
MSDRVVVIIHLTVAGYGDEFDAGIAAVHAAYRRVSWVTDRIEGLLRTELLTDSADSGDLLLVSEWTDLDAFHAWREGPDHAGGARNSALKPFQDRSRARHFVVYRSIEAH